MNITEEEDSVKEVCMPYDTGHYCIMCDKNGIVANVKETATGNEIQCKLENGWGEKSDDTTRCGDYDIVPGSG